MPDAFRVFETERFIKDLEDDFSGQKDKIKKKLQTYVYPALKTQPFYGANIRKLVNFMPPTWRYRIGDYRFFYSIDIKEKTVNMLKISGRGGAY